jgi:uncharacterized protein involved in exopolysaccharide biosynthesis
MIENRELSMDDYLAMLRRRLKVILIPALLAPLAGFLISFAFPPKYTSQSLILVEGQKVPEGYVKPVVTEDVGQRIATMEQQILTHNRLRPMIDRLGLAKGRSVDEAVADIRANISIEQVETDLTMPTAGGAPKKKKTGQTSTVPGFYVNFTASSPKEAQDTCSGLTSILLEENLKLREAVAQSTTDFLSRQLDQAKRDLDDQDSKLAAFKKQYMGQLPGEEENNLRILMGLNSQLDANTQSLNRAQQDKSYTESLLAQQVAAWKSTQSATNPQTLEQQLASLQSQLITLQARYTDDHPDVVKTKADIAEVRRRLDEMNSAAAQNTQAKDQASASEPPEIRQLRLQVHQYDQVIVQATRDQQRLQEQIRAYQGRVALSPAVEEQYKLLTRDYNTAQKFYNDLLTKRSESSMQTDMERGQQGEQMRLLNPADLPDSPSFPNRWLFTGGGLGAGLAIGLGLALWMELRDKSIRTEQDVLAAMELPMLVSLPWVNPDPAVRNENGRFRIRSKPSDKEKQTVEV